jgi:hypothetical protein
MSGARREIGVNIRRMSDKKEKEGEGKVNS